ncbi:MAG TPA: M56 family metallopeptidase [Pyrinomonadaceae bacterium]|jgi:beta-lactamase regulating signal transducer with metallopeptidase domain|nr:M56 family metallopeptidase [Pyrinomonadaceae bacterium]
MRIASQLLLTFLLNACWQIALVAGFASLSSWLLRNSAARYRHWVWVAALLLALGIPITTSSQMLGESVAAFVSQPTETTTIQPVVFTERRAIGFSEPLAAPDVFLLNRSMAVFLVGVYFAVFAYGSYRFVRAWDLTRRLRRTSVELDHDERISALIQQCANAISRASDVVPIRFSETVPVPLTIGVLKPIIILPQQLLAEANDEVLTSAIGHELIHVRRRDYALNFIYELLYLPLLFHPAAALIRRRIRQTRELSCDELVAERVMNAEIYARSLVKLASSAPPLRRLSVTTNVGIADADILEARIMSLLRKPKLDTRRKRMILIAISLLLAVPCIAAASLAVKFDLKPTESAVQEPSQQEKELKEKERTEKRKLAAAIYEDDFKERMQKDPKFREEVMLKQELEFKMRAIRQAALLKMARISMDQAIQIATSKQPGQVLQCSLDAEHWEEPGKLARDGFVFYHVIIVSGEDVDSGAATHVLVNAVDGTIIRAEKELPRKLRKPEEHP